MSKKEILIGREFGLTRVAVLEDGELCEFYLEREGARKLAGNIYKGRVQNVLPGMQAAFVDIGTDKNAFLYVGDAGVDQPSHQRAGANQVAGVLGPAGGLVKGVHAGNAFSNFHRNASSYLPIFVL